MRTAVLAAAMALMPVAASAVQYTNGWTAPAFDHFVKGCVDTAVSRQLDFMSSHGQVRPDAGPADMDALRSRVTVLENRLCTCIGQRIMQDVRFEDVQGIFQRKDYVRQTGLACASAMRAGS